MRAILVLASLMSFAAMSPGHSRSTYTERELLDLCTIKKDANELMCLVYINGMFDMWSASKEDDRSSCLGNPTGADIREMVIKHLRESEGPLLDVIGGAGTALIAFDVAADLCMRKK